MPKRPVDAFAGTGSLADKLRKRREAIESGDPSGGQQISEAQPAQQPNPGDVYNHPQHVLKRGYYVEKD